MRRTETTDVVNDEILARTLQHRIGRKETVLRSVHHMISITENLLSYLPRAPQNWFVIIIVPRLLRLLSLLFRSKRRARTIRLDMSDSSSGNNVARNGKFSLQ